MDDDLTPEQFRRAANKVAFNHKLNALLKKEWFDVTVFKDVANLGGVFPPVEHHEDYDALSDLHCVPYSAMSKAMAAATKKTILRVLNVPEFEVIEGDARSFERTLS